MLRVKMLVVAAALVSALGLLCLAPVQALAVTEEGVQVTFSASSRFQAKQGAEKRAKEEAVRTYVRRATPGIDPGCLSQITSSYARFVTRTIQEDFSFSGSTATASYRVYLDDSQINRVLEEMGCAVQSADVPFFIMEEPPTAASMSLMLDEMAADGMKPLRGLGPFVDFYPDFQRAIRDSITRKANQEGLKLTWLENVPSMRAYKSTPDDPLMGVNFDMDAGDFVINRKLMDQVRRTYASKNAIIYYYRIDSLYFDQVKRDLKAKISISLLDLKTNEAKSVGSREFAVKLIDKVPSVALRDGLAEVSANAAALLMNDAKKEARRMASSAQQRMARQGAEPGKVTVLLSSKRKMNQLKRKLADNSSVTGAAMEGETVVFTLSPGASVDDFIFGSLYDAFDELGLNIPEDNVHLEGKSAVIRE